MPNVCDNFCDDCIYMTKIHGTERCCNYYFATGKRRPCSSGADCTVRHTRQQLRDKQMALDAKRRATLREKTIAEKTRIVICGVCGTEFTTTDGKRKYCTNDCLAEARRRAARRYNERKRNTALSSDEIIFAADNNVGCKLES